MESGGGLLQTFQRIKYCSNIQKEYKKEQNDIVALKRNIAAFNEIILHFNSSPVHYKVIDNNDDNLDDPHHLDDDDDHVFC